MPAAARTAAIPVAIPADARRILAARAARSVGQGALAAAFALYLHALGWDAPAIGGVLAAGLLVGALLSLWIGPLSDRVGRRRFLLGYELLTMACALAPLLTRSDAVLAAGAVLVGFGRGANGSAGPFGPLEQAWLAQRLAAGERARVFGLNARLGFAGMALGALLVALPQTVPAWRGGLLAYQLLFLLPLAGSAAGFVLLRGAADQAPPPARAPRPGRPAGDDTRADAATRQAENRLLRRLGMANALNGLGIGMVSPLIAYWFALRYGHGAATVGPAMAASFLAAAAGTVLADGVVRRVGVVRAVVGLRGLGLLMLGLTPFAPSFWLAATLYALRAALNQGTLGARQALTVGLTGEGRRGLAATVNNVSVQVPRALAPTLSAALLQAGWLVAPFVTAAAFQAGYLLLYWRFFRHHEPPRAGTAKAVSTPARAGNGPARGQEGMR
jgi:MFS family permease